MIALLWTAAALAADCTVIANADEVVLPAGPAKGATVVVDGTRIAAVGTVAFESAAGGARWNGRTCALIDAKGGVVTAGLFEARSQLGVTEIDLEDVTKDLDAGGDPIRAALRVGDGYDPRSAVIGIQRVAGVTGAVIHPDGGLIAGRSAYVSLYGDLQADTVVAPVVAMEATGSSSPSRSYDLLALREVLDDAKAWRANQAAWERNQTRAYAASRLDLAALLDVVDGRIPLVVGADRAADIEALLRFHAETGVRLVIVGAAEGWRMADALAAAKIPVIVDPMVYGPGSVDQLAGRPENPGLLAKAGVPVTISTFSTHNARNLRQYAGNAVRAGMDRYAAIAAITARPAEAFGVPDRGRVATGSVADLVVWSGDPLELSTVARHTLIGGVEIPRSNRQTALRDRYRTLPGTPVPPLEQP
jgi:imidazolonepropionase-like amidohydrolase